MRLIDADELEKNLSNDLPYKGSVKRVLIQAPTVEAEPVRRGKWVCIFEPDENDNVQCNCSVCGAGDLHAKNTVVPYCWKCGAKMDGD